MPEIIAHNGQHSYSVHIRNGLLQELGRHLAPRYKGRRILVVSDEQVAQLYLSPLLQSLYQAGIATASCCLPPGEREKNMHNLNRIYTACYMAQMSRSDAILALGGGVVGDLAGFAAATYMRGLGLIQVPSSLIAQVDSALGGKNGVDMPFGKNMVGTTYQPDAVYIDPLVLRSLPAEEMTNGMAEVIKYAAIRDTELFARLEQHSLDLEWVIGRCCSLKLDIVRRDTGDHGERMILNFGHSFGHALERISNYEVYRHGEAIAIGMNLACRLGERLGYTSPETRERIAKLIQSYHLPLESEVLEAEEVFEALKTDKKRRGEQLNFIFVEEPGKTRRQAISYEVLERLLPPLFS